jgi:alkylated DNA repair dioxygenase AlkB
MCIQEMKYPGFACHKLDDAHALYSGRVPSHLGFSESQFEQLWNEHPDEFHEIMMHGRLVKTPRWQQAYGKDYHYTGNVNKALALPQLLEPLLCWCQEAIDARLNGILLNWYDGSLDHYIGAHRDSTVNMYEGAPIVTVSLGEERTFRLRPWKGRAMRDFPAPDGTVFIMPYSTNLAWTHEVPKRKHFQKRRVSITLRAFQ